MHASSRKYHISHLLLEHEARQKRGALLDAKVIEHAAYGADVTRCQRANGICNRAASFEGNTEGPPYLETRINHPEMHLLYTSKLLPPLAFGVDI